jgi:REP-associated tyrosine transposase
MPYFYPTHLPEPDTYVGKRSYALTFSTENRLALLDEKAQIDLVVAQVRRAATENGFAIVVHCVMPDHVHLVVDGLRDDSNCLAFIKAAKQYAGYDYKQRYGRPLWQRYGYERVIRDDFERAMTIRYLLANPVRAGIVADPRRYIGLGSDRHTVEELMMISEYSSAHVLE